MFLPVGLTAAHRLIHLGLLALEPPNRRLQRVDERHTLSCLIGATLEARVLLLSECGGTCRTLGFECATIESLLEVTRLAEQLCHLGRLVGTHGIGSATLTIALLDIAHGCGMPLRLLRVKG